MLKHFLYSITFDLQHHGHYKAQKGFWILSYNTSLRRTLCQDKQAQGQFRATELTISSSLSSFTLRTKQQRQQYPRPPSVSSPCQQMLAEHPVCRISSHWNAGTWTEGLSFSRQTQQRGHWLGACKGFYKYRAKLTMLTSFLHHNIIADRDNFRGRDCFGSQLQRFLLPVPASLLWCFHEAEHHERRACIRKLLTSWQKPRNQNKCTDTSERPSSFHFIYSGFPTG